MGRYSAGAMRGGIVRSEAAQAAAWRPLQPWVTSASAEEDLPDKWWKIKWHPPLVALFMYTFVIITYKLGIAGPSMWVALIGLAMKPALIRTPGVIRWFTAFVAWSLVGCILGPYPIPALEGMIGQLKILLIFGVALSVLRTQGQIRFFLVLFAASFIVVPARAAVFAYLGGHRGFGGRAVGSFIYDNPNDLGAMCLLTMGLSLAAMSLFPKQKWMKAWLLFSVGFLAVIILMTQSRGVFLGLAAMTGPFFIRSIWGNPKRLAIMALVGVLVIAIAPRGVWTRVGMLGNITSAGGAAAIDPEGSGRERMYILRIGMQILADHWVVGVGKNQAPVLNNDYASWGGPKDIHNSYLTIMIETGAFGFLLFLGMIGGVLNHASRAIRMAKGKRYARQVEALRWLRGTAAGFLVCALFATYFHLPHPMLFFAVIWALAQSVIDNVRKDQRARALAQQAA